MSFASGRGYTMLLSLLSSSRRLRILAVLLILVVNVVAPAFCATLPTPTITNVTGTCLAETASWGSSGSDAMYEVMLFSNGSPQLVQVVSGTSITFSNLSPGNYSLMVEALSISGTSTNSGFSSMFPFTVTCGPVCQLPVVMVTTVTPSILCRKNHGSIPVTFRGTVTSACALSGVQYTLIDSLGSGSQGSVSVASDGSFMVNLTLSARHMGRVYTFTVSAVNSVGRTTSPPVMLDVQKCTRTHSSRGEDNDNDHDD